MDIQWLDSPLPFQNEQGNSDVGEIERLASGGMGGMVARFRWLVAVDDSIVLTTNPTGCHEEMEIGHIGID